MTAPTSQSIRLKIAEYSEIGERAFLRRYSKGRSARNAYLLDGDEPYDLKAIWGAAHDPPMAPAKFHTNDARTGVVGLGFEFIELDRRRDKATTEAFDDYLEGARRKSETIAFLRNPQLIAEAKRKYGTCCMCCGFNFEEKYGEHGKNYIECHHKHELSQDRKRNTRIEDVAVVCTNCHRMIHRQRNRMLTVEALKEMIRQNTAR